MSEVTTAAPAPVTSTAAAAPAGAPPAGTPPAAPPKAPTAADLSISTDAPAKTDAAPGDASDVGKSIISYDKTGDVGLDMALGFVGKLGYGPDHPAMKAAANGDFSLMRAELASKGDKAAGWEQYIALAEKSHADGKAKADEANTKALAAIHEAAGGPENWNAIKTWAGENATPEEKASVNAALAAGGIAAKAMVAWLGEKMTGSPTRPQEPQAVTVPSAKGAAPLNGALTATQYATAVQEGRQKLGNRWDASPEYRSLQQRRLAGRAAGI